jgi:hypothetical protein
MAERVQPSRSGRGALRLGRPHRNGSERSDQKGRRRGAQGFEGRPRALRFFTSRRKIRGRSTTQISFDKASRSRARAVTPTPRRASMAMRAKRSRARAKGSTRNGFANTAPIGRRGHHGQDRGNRRALSRTQRAQVDEQKPAHRHQREASRPFEAGHDKPRRKERSDQARQENAIAPRRHREHPRLLGHREIDVGIETRQRESIPSHVGIEVVLVVIPDESGADQKRHQQSRRVLEESGAQAAYRKRKSVSEKRCASCAGSP